MGTYNDPRHTTTTQEARAPIAAASHHDKRCTAAPQAKSRIPRHPYAGAGARCMATTLGGEKHPPGQVASACGAGSDKPEERAQLGSATAARSAPACPHARAQPFLARCTRKSVLSNHEVCGSARLGGGGSATLSGAHSRIGPQVASGGGGEWRRLPGDDTSRSARPFAVKRDSRTRQRTARRSCTFRRTRRRFFHLWCTALREALRRCREDCRAGAAGWSRDASCCCGSRPDASLPCCWARRTGVPGCLALSCQDATERVVVPSTTRSVTTTFQAPSRVALRRCVDAHVSNGSIGATAAAAPAAAAGAVRSPRSSAIQIVSS